MCDEGGHRYLRLVREVEIACVCVWNDERVVARGAREVRDGREDAEGLLENGMYCDVRADLGVSHYITSPCDPWPASRGARASP